MVAMKNEILTACDQLVAAALNGVCQGMLLVLLVWAGLRALGRGTNAATRHAVWFGTLFLAVLIVPDHGAANQTRTVGSAVGIRTVAEGARLCELRASPLHRLGGELRTIGALRPDACRSQQKKKSSVLH